MKTKGRRKSTNIEQQTPKQKKVAEFGLKLQKAAHANETLKEKTPLKDQGLSEEGKMFGALTNPGAMVPRMLQGNAPAIKDKVTKSPAERRGIKDPKPTHFSKKGDFPFFKHKVKDK